MGVQKKLKFSYLTPLSHTWCKHFYDPDPVEDWEVEILTKFKEQFYKRIAEAPSMFIPFIHPLCNKGGGALHNKIARFVHRSTPMLPY